MKSHKVVQRLRRIATEPELLDQVARDTGFALARSERAALREVAGELAARAPVEQARDASYWAGFAAGLGTLLAAYDSAFEREDARASALRVVSSDSAQAAIRLLAAEPLTGAGLAERLNITQSGASRLLAALRGAGLARVLGGLPYPARGARKPHVLTSLGSWVADELTRTAGSTGLRAAAER